MKKFLLVLMLLLSLALTGCEGMDLDLGGINGGTENGEAGEEGNEQEGTTILDQIYISFNTNGGTSVESIKISEIITTGVIPTTSKEGYYFAGWYLGEEKFDFSNIKTIQNLTLEAKWMTEEEYFSIANDIEIVTELNVLQIASILNNVCESLKTDNFKIKAESYGSQTGTVELTIIGNSEDEYQGYLKTEIPASPILGTPEAKVEAYLKDGYVYASIDSEEDSKIKVEISEYLGDAADAKATLIDTAGLSALKDVIDLSAYEPANIGMDAAGNLVIEVHSAELEAEFRVVVRNNKIAYFEYCAEGFGQKVFVQTENVSVDFSGLVPEEYTETELN